VDDGDLGERDHDGPGWILSAARRVRLGGQPLIFFILRCQSLLTEAVVR
jgi:hypothetical protein